MYLTFSNSQLRDEMLSKPTNAPSNRYKALKYKNNKQCANSYHLIIKGITMSCLLETFWT